MDLFTHVVISYLLNVGLELPTLNISLVERPVIEYGVITGVLPDIDIVWCWLAFKYKLARHRGFSHSIIFVLLYSIILSLIFSTYFLDVSFVTLFIVSMTCGCCHLGADALTNWGVPLFAPFSNREYKLDIDRALNFYLMVGSIGIIVFMNHLHRISYPHDLFLQVCLIVTLSYIVYILARTCIKLYITNFYPTASVILPTANPFIWYVVHYCYYRHHRYHNNNNPMEKQQEHRRSTTASSTIKYKNIIKYSKCNLFKILLKRSRKVFR